MRPIFVTRVRAVSEVGLTAAGRSHRLLDNKAETNCGSSMATKQHSSPERSLPTPDWKQYEHQRALVLWQVVALSLNTEPDLKLVELAKQDSGFAASYARRKKFLGRMLSVEPLDGHVTYFPWHEYNKSKATTSNRMVDPVSCIEKLMKLEGEKLPEDFVALLEPLKRIPLPKDPRGGGGIYVNPSVTIVAGPGANAPPVGAATANYVETKKRDQSKAIETKAAEQRAAMLYAVVCDVYGYDPTDAESLKMAVDAVNNALVARGIAGKYGLSPGKIEQALKVGEGQCPPPPL